MVFHQSAVLFLIINQNIYFYMGIVYLKTQQKAGIQSIWMFLQNIITLTGAP